MGGFCCKNLNIKEVRTRRKGKGKGKGNIAQQAKRKKRKPRSLTGYGIYSSKQFKLNLKWNLFQNSGNRRYSISKPSISILLICVSFFLLFHQLVRYGFGCPNSTHSFWSLSQLPSPDGAAFASLK